MSNWNSRTMPYFSEHSRSASVAGYQDVLNSDIDPPKYDHNWLNRPSGQFYSSSMDISKSKPDSKDYQRFTWKSTGGKHPISNSVSSYPEAMDTSQRQRPFETAFKTAISKMKESSLSRLGVVEKNVPAQNIGKSNGSMESNKFYMRNCQTLPLSRTHHIDSDRKETTKKIFRCEPSLNKGLPNVYSVSQVSRDIVSDSESDKTMKDNQYKSETNLFEDQNKNLLASSKTYITYSKHGTNSKSGNSIIIPVKDSKSSNVPKEPISIKTEAYISPIVYKTNQTSLPPTIQNINDNNNSDDPNFECLPSVKEIISKVEALNNQSGTNIMSKSLNITREKPPILISNKSTSQRTLDYTSSPATSIESPITAQKRMSGLYKKNISSNSKGKSISNMPSDFQKLHLAFLDQKQEILRLRQELTEKNALINQLETDLRNYEPWR